MDHLNVKRISQSLLITIMLLGTATASMGNTMADSWIYFARDAKNILRVCPKNVNIEYPRTIPYLCFGPMRCLFFHLVEIRSRLRCYRVWAKASPYGKI